MTIPNSFRPASTIVALCVLMIFASGQSTAQEGRAQELLRQMSAEIAGLDDFVITGDGYVDARLSAGQIVEQSMDVTLRMSRPDAMRITNVDAEATKEIYFGNGVLTVYDQSRKFYAQRDVPAGVDAAAEYAVEELGIDAPMLDFVSSDVAGHLLEDAENVQYFGLSRFRGMSYHHIGIRQIDVDLQIWISAEGPPLPGKLAISAKWEGGSPRSVFFFNWDIDPDFDRRSFRFEPPPGSTKIEFDTDY